MKKLIFVLAAAFILSFIPGCQVCSVENTSIFGNWAIEDLPSATAKKIKPAPKANIVIQSARVHGCAGDNRFFGSVKIEDNNGSGSVLKYNTSLLAKQTVNALGRINS